MESEELRIEYHRVKDVVRWSKNPKRHDIGAIVESIRRYGFVDPPKWDATLGALVYGNGRDEALAWMEAQGDDIPRGIKQDDNGDWWMPVKVGLDAPTVQEAEALAIDHNNLTMSGGDFTAFDMARMWDTSYTDILSGLGEALPITVDDEALTALLAEVNVPAPGVGGDEFDPTPADGPTRTQLGDLWRIGGVHRLLVGDCTDPANVERLMGGERADILWSDAPYNVDYEGGAGKIDNDAMSPEDFRAFLFVAFKSADSVMKLGAVYYLAHSDVAAYEFIGAVRDVGWVQAHPPTLQWIKDSLVLGRGDYHSRSEPILYGWKPGSAHHAVKDRTQDNVWEILRPKTNEDHPTMKPIELVGRAIRNSSSRNDLVIDWFLGSGTTIIAAHRTGRRCYGCEISERYCDVVLRRAESEGLTCELVERANA